MDFTGLSLFSGGGAMDLAFEEEGFEIKGQVEIDAYCNAVLDKHWPGKPRWGDIKTLGRRGLTGMGIGSTVTAIWGGAPCQPYSNAGQRRGTADDRHLWPQMRRLIRMLSPRFVLFENVPGIVRMVLDDILADLESAGYAAIPFIVPACAVGAVHRRDRVFVVAHAQADSQAQLAAVAGREQALGGPGFGTGGGTLGGDLAQGIPVDGRTAARGAEDVEYAARRRTWTSQQPGQLCGAQPSGDMAHPTGKQCQWAEYSRQWRPGSSDGSQGVGLADAFGPRLEIGQSLGSNDLEELTSAGRSSRDHIPDADFIQADRAAIARSERRDGTIESRLGRATARTAYRLDRTRWPVPPGQEQEAWEAPRTTTAKIPNRAARLKMLGNSVVWQVVAQFAKAIRLTLEEERLNGR